MTLRVVPVHNQPIPSEWVQAGHADGKTVLAWASEAKPERKRSKFNARAGVREDLNDLYLKSSLEANTLRLLLFQGYQLWRDKKTAPPPGRWVRYEGQRIRLVAFPGTSRERPVDYVPDLHLWDETGYHLWECKGDMNQRSKQKLRLMAEQRPEIRVEVITAGVLNGLAMQAIAESRLRGGPGSILGWEG